MRRAHKLRYLAASGWLIISVLVASVLALSQATAAGSGLFSRWKFDELTAGSIVADSSGSGYDGTPYGSGGPQNLPQPSTNVPPTAFGNPRSLQFDGVDDYVDISDWVADTSSGFSVSLWAYPTSNGSWARFIDFGNGQQADNIIFSRLDTSSSLQFEIYEGANTTKIIASNGLINNEWHHYAATIDADGNATIYRDGVALASGTTNKPVNILRTNKYIGKSNWPDAYYEGFMDDLRFYDRALTEEELVDMATGDPGSGAPPLDDNDGISAATEDAAPNAGDANNDGTPDSVQASVASFVNSVTGVYAAVEVDGACALSNVGVIPSGQHGRDGNYTYPLGLLDFTAVCGSNGFTATIKHYFYDPPAGNFTVRKFASGAYSAVPGATFAVQTIGGRQVLVVSYQITDGSALDGDQTANGVIVDPAGPAIAGQSGASNGGMLAETGQPVVLAYLAASLLIAGSWRFLKKRTI